MSIGYNGLGNNGRLGNQMFQYAALRGIAAHRGTKRGRYAGGRLVKHQ